MKLADRDVILGYRKLCYDLVGEMLGLLKYGDWEGEKNSSVFRTLVYLVGKTQDVLVNLDLELRKSIEL